MPQKMMVIVGKLFAREGLAIATVAGNEAAPKYNPTAIASDGTILFTNQEFVRSMRSCFGLTDVI